MHDSALRIGEIFFNQYWHKRFSVVVELGSYDINGSLRRYQPNGSFWVGLDVEPGPSVDVCIKPGGRLPIANESADVVLATSVFEHDELFWMTFNEMCRIAKTGGFIYINAPSNGDYHRYPQDCWRFYPDASRALEKWARSRDMEITLSESFVANRQTDIWNDFVAVFGKGPLAQRPEAQFVHPHVSCRNVHRMGQPSILLHRPATEDMDLIRDRAATIEKLKVAELLDLAEIQIGEGVPGRHKTISGLRSSPPRLFTTHGTILYVDTASGELRHGPIDGSPTNAVFAPDGVSGQIMHEAVRSLRTIICLADRSQTVDSATKIHAAPAPTVFDSVRLHRRWIGLKAAGRFLCAEPDGRVTLSRELCRAWESFLPLDPGITAATKQPQQMDGAKRPNAEVDSEVPVTPEMRDAGASVIETLRGAVSSYSLAVEVYTAMRRKEKAM